MRHYLRILLSQTAWVIGLGLFLADLTVSAQPIPQIRESAVKAAYLLKFANFVEWPADTFSSETSPLVIGVVSDEMVANELEQFANERFVKSRTVVVRRIQEPKSAASVHILYIGALRPSRVQEFIPPENNPTLVVTNLDDELPPGANINFLQSNGRIRFAASIPASESRRLLLSSRLLSVAQHVKGGGK